MLSGLWFSLSNCGLPFINEPGVSGLTAIDIELVTITLNDEALTSGTVLNIQSGVYAGGGPAGVVGDSISLPSPLDDTIVFLLNGQEILSGTDVVRVSATQISFNCDLRADDQIKVRKWA